MSIADAFQHHGTGLESPANFAKAITPSDSADLSDLPRALYAAVDGAVRVTLRSGGDPVSFARIAGVPLPLRVKRVWATGTTASGLVGVW